MPILKDILTGILTKGDGKIADIIKDTADELIYSKQEKAQDNIEYQKWQEENEYRSEVLDADQFQKSLEQLVELEKLDVDNIKDARNREISITTADNVGWLNKNIMPLIAFFILLATFVMYIILIFKKTAIIALDMAVVGSIIDTFKTLSTLIVGYYFGSSLSSSVKNKIIDNLNNKQNENKEIS